MNPIRVRFAPSPTGALHIGGVRTALYNYLVAKRLGGTFVLRIEDTDQARFVPGAQEYILEALEWCGLTPDEGPSSGGDYGPYRQSERKALYQKYAQQLVDSGHAYYAFDTAEELDARREAEKAAGNHNFRYDAGTRSSMRNSLILSQEETNALLDKGTNYTIRLKIDPGSEVTIEDIIRGDVRFQTAELDDKIILKADGMPTYHLANIVDDHLMKISHVIRGEEWLPSTAHHVLLYQFLGWSDSAPAFAHLPLILKPTGKGKLSKRDGKKLGIPVFPLSWEAETEEDSFVGFREFGFDPRAVVNFLAFLGWNPGTEQEMFSLEELIDAFSLEKVGKGGARFDFDKAKWYNQQYIIQSDATSLLPNVRAVLKDKGHEPSDPFLIALIELLQERVVLYPDFYENAYFFFEPIREYEAKPVRKKWSTERAAQFTDLRQQLSAVSPYEAAPIKAAVEAFMASNSLKFGDVLPLLRVALTGSSKGPALFEMMELMGKDFVSERLTKATETFNIMVSPTE